MDKDSLNQLITRLYATNLEFRQINIESTIKSQGCSYGRNYLANQTIQIYIIGTLNVQLSTTYIKDGFVVNNEGTVRMRHCVMRCQ